jgi:hypothetical protein
MRFLSAQTCRAKMDSGSPRTSCGHTAVAESRRRPRSEGMASAGERWRVACTGRGAGRAAAGRDAGGPWGATGGSVRGGHEGVGQLLGMSLAGMARYDSADTVTGPGHLGCRRRVRRRTPVGSGSVAARRGDLASMISRTGRPVRIDSYEGVPGRIAEFVRETLGVCASAGSPIVVEGRAACSSCPR